MKIQIEESALETMKVMVQRLQDERDMLLKATKTGVAWMYAGNFGGEEFNNDYKKVCATIAACTDGTKVIES